MASKLHHLFKSEGNFSELMGFAYCNSIGGVPSVGSAPAASVSGFFLRQERKR